MTTELSEQLLITKLTRLTEKRETICEDMIMHLLEQYPSILDILITNAEKGLI